jgi:hypothetical protein
MCTSVPAGCAALKLSSSEFCFVGVHPVVAGGNHEGAAVDDDIAVGVDRVIGGVDGEAVFGLISDR